MASTKPLQERLYHEILGRIQETDLSVPVKRDDYFYYTRTEEGKAYSIQCRKHGNLDASEEVLLDANFSPKDKSISAWATLPLAPITGCWHIPPISKATNPTRFR